jgi:hypothetical protein
MLLKAFGRVRIYSLYQLVFFLLLTYRLQCLQSVRNLFTMEEGSKTSRGGSGIARWPLHHQRRDQGRTMDGMRKLILTKRWATMCYHQLGTKRYQRCRQHLIYLVSHRHPLLFPLYYIRLCSTISLKHLTNLHLITLTRLHFDNLSDLTLFFLTLFYLSFLIIS